MSAEIGSGAIALLQYLLPGFVAAWIFYGLTSHPKPSQFERLVQALIFTFIVHVLSSVAQGSLSAFGSTARIASSIEAIPEVLPLTLAILVGIALAYFANGDSFHGALRKVGLTTRTSHPSEWFSVFSLKVTYVVLQLHDGRRLVGWPKEWPIDPERGQFYMMQPAWIQDDGTVTDLPELDGLLVPAKNVDWVEFMRMPEVVSHE